MAIDHYATLLDVNAMIPQAPFTSTSKPSDAQVTDFIEQIANDMDVVMATKGYTVPVVSGDIGLAWLRATCKFGVLGQALAVRDSGVSTAVSARDKETPNIWLQIYEARMKGLADPSTAGTKLADVPATTAQLAPEDTLRSFAQSVIDDPSYDPNAPQVTRYQTL